MISDLVFNVLGLLLNISGAGLMFWGSPKISSQVFLYNKSEKEGLQKIDKANNQKIRWGMILLFLGFVFQFIALFV